MAEREDIIIRQGPKDVDFLVLQYQALREEILHLKKRIALNLGLGLIGIPIFIGAGFKLGLQPVIIASPLVTVAFMFILMFEQNSLVRAGRFIREHIEPALLKKGTRGWEEFLEDCQENRHGEKLFSLAAYLIFGMYYFIGMLQSFRQLRNIELGNPLEEIIKISELGKHFPLHETSTFVVVGFAAIFLVVFWTIMKDLKIKTTGVPKQYAMIDGIRGLFAWAKRS